MLEYLNKSDTKVSILLCDDAFIQKLNKEFRGKNSPTDVLSFSMSEGEVLHGDSSLLGDIVISVETAARQAPPIHHTPTEEVTSLMIHGLLHLLGYSHSTRKDEDKMQQRARELEAVVFKRYKSKLSSTCPKNGN